MTGQRTYTLEHGMTWLVRGMVRLTERVTGVSARDVLIASAAFGTVTAMMGATDGDMASLEFGAYLSSGSLALLSCNWRRLDRFRLTDRPASELARLRDLHPASGQYRDMPAGHDPGCKACYYRRGQLRRAQSQRYRTGSIVRPVAQDRLEMLNQFRGYGPATAVVPSCTCGSIFHEDGRCRA
jgi:hypothetical protein